MYRLLHLLLVFPAADLPARGTQESGFADMSSPHPGAGWHVTKRLNRIVCTAVVGMSYKIRIRASKGTFGVIVGAWEYSKYVGKALTSCHVWEKLSSIVGSFLAFLIVYVPYSSDATLNVLRFECFNPKLLWYLTYLCYLNLLLPSRPGHCFRLIPR